MTARHTCTIAALLLLAGLLVTGMWGDPLLAQEPPPADADQTIAVPSYFYPGPLWTQMEEAVPTVGLAIINPFNGPGATQNPDYTAQVIRSQAAGLTVLGYVHSSYGLRPVAEVKADIDRFYDWYNVDGIFIDEVSTDCGLVSGPSFYYQELYDHIQGSTLPGGGPVQGTLTVLNPGQQTNECYMAVGDVIVNFEGSYDNTGPPPIFRTYTDDYLAPSWVADYPPERFWHLVYTAWDVAAMQHAVALSKERHAGWVYITPDDLHDDNPWDSLPPDGAPGSYWAEELAAVRPDPPPPAPLCVALPAGVVGWWPGEENANDIIGGFDGVRNGADFTVGKVGKAFALDGQDDFVSFGSGPAITGDGAFAVEAWVATTDQGVIVQQRDIVTPDGWTGQYVLGVGVWSATGGQVAFVTYGADGAPGIALASSRTVDDGLLHHIVAVREADGTGRIYIDGVLDASQPASPQTLVARQVYVGGDLRDNDKFLRGSVDEIAIYNRSLALEEIAQSFAAGRAGKCHQPPTITPAIAGTAGQNGWYVSDVSVSWTIDNNGFLPISQSGCEATAISADMAGTTLLCTADSSGGSASTSVTLMRDATPPVVSVTGVEEGAVYPPGSVHAAGCNTQDALSGVATPAVLSVTGGPSTFTATCSGAQDFAGNTASASVTYQVLNGFSFNGFFPPVENPPVVNRVKAGQAIPLKFSLGGDFGLDIFADGFPASVEVACDSGDPISDIAAIDGPGQSGLSYDPDADRYTFVWKSEKGWADQCRLLVLRLSDGSEQTATFKFK